MQNPQHAQKQAFELLFFIFKSMKQYFEKKINILSQGIYTTIAKTVFSFFPCVAIIISSITSYCFFKKADLLALHWNSNLQ